MGDVVKLPPPKVVWIGVVPRLSAGLLMQMIRGGTKLNELCGQQFHVTVRKPKGE